MKQHTWVRFSYAPVEVELTQEGNIDVFVTTISSDVEAIEAVFGCWFCHEPLTVESHDSECPFELA